MQWGQTEGESRLELHVTDGEVCPAPTVVTAIEALARNAKEIAELYRAARRALHGAVAPDDASDLVWEVLGELATGTLRRDASCDMPTQILREIHGRAQRLRRKAWKSTEVSAEAPNVRAQVHAIPAPPPDEEPRDAIDVAELMPRVRTLAADDPAVLELLSLYERNIVLRRDVLRHGMTPGRYRASIARLMRYAQQARTEWQSAVSVPPPA